MLRVGSRAQVMHGNAKMTGGGLKKKDLTYNKAGKIVSKKMSKMAKNEMRLQKAGYITAKGVFQLFQKQMGGDSTSSDDEDNERKESELVKPDKATLKKQQIKRLTNKELNQYKNQSYYENLVEEIKQVNEISNNRRKTYQKLRREGASKENKGLTYMTRAFFLGMFRYTHIWMNRIQATVFIIGPYNYDFTKPYNTEYDNLNFGGLAFDAPLLVNKGVNQNRRIGTSSSQLLYTSTLSDSRKLSYNKNISEKYFRKIYTRQEYSPHFSIIKKVQIKTIKKMIGRNIQIKYDETYKDLLDLNTDWTYFWGKPTVYNRMILFVPKKSDELDEGVEPPNIMHVDVKFGWLAKKRKDIINNFLKRNKVDILYISGHNYGRSPTMGQPSSDGVYDVEQSVFLNYNPEWFETIIQINYSNADRCNNNEKGLKQVKNITTFQFLK